MKSRRSLALSRALPLTLVGLLTSTSSFGLPTTTKSSSAVPFDKSEAQISDDIAFAKGLAKEWGFVDLAGQVIRQIEKEGVSAATGERLGVVKCEIYAQGAIAERDRVRRNELFEQALSAYEEFLKENPNSPSAPEARSGYISMSMAFARSLEISMEEAIGAEAETLRLRRREVLIAANERTRTLIEELSSNREESEVEKRERVNVMMMRAQINIELGISSEDGTASFNNARDILEDVTTIAGEASPAGLRAFDMIGKAYAAEQNWEMAAMFFEAVIEQALPSNYAEWYENVQAAIDAGHTRPRERVSTTDLALRIAQQVVSENQGNVLRVKGQKLIADIISRGGEVDPSVLFEAAEGKYFGKEYAEAIDGFKLVLAALEGKDQATRIELGPKTFLRMGNSYNRLDLNFEAAMAFREGCTTWQGDPENDQYNANGYYKMMQELAQKAPGDAVLKRLYEESQNIAAQLSTRDQDQILYEQAERLRRNKDYDGAIAKYAQIKQSAIDYEKALVNIAVCTYRKGQQDAGYKLFVDYLENFVKDAKNSVSGAKEVKRTDASATAGFYRALHEYSTEQYAKLLASSAEYYKDFPDQTSMAPWVMHMVGHAFAKQGQLDQARRLLKELSANYPENVNIAQLADKLYNDLAELRDKSVDPEVQMDLLGEMVTLLETSNEISSKPKLTNLRNESKHWIELGNWDKAVPVLEKVIAKFGDDPDQTKFMETYVLPDLGQGYIEQGRVAEAHAVLAALIASESVTPSKQTLLNYARSVTGWVAGTAAEIIEVPGAGQSVEAFQDACDKLNILSNSVDEKWACEWYSLKFQQAYGYYKWATAEGGPKDDKKLATAEQQLNALVQQLGPNFKGKSGVDGVNEVCEADPVFGPEFGQDVLRRRLVWLWGKVK